MWKIKIQLPTLFNIDPNVFTASRIRITEALAAQAGIALENSRLYQQIQDSLQTQTQLTAANQRFVPEEMLSGLGYKSIVDVDINVATEREMNVVFVDIQSFTTLSAQLGAQGTISLINKYLSHIQPGISANNGFVGSQP